MTSQVTYMHTPASFGAEVVETFGDGSMSVYQIANPRGTRCLLFALRGEAGWMPATTVSKPERFMDAPPETGKEFAAIIERWIGEVASND